MVFRICENCFVRVRHEEGKCSKCAKTFEELTPVTTMFQCAQYDLFDELKSMLEEQGMDVNSRDDCGATVLHWSCLNNHMAMVSYLITIDGIDINALGGDLKSTPIYWAARRNHVYVVDELLKAGADPSIRDLNGVSTFYLAIQCEFWPMAAFLVAKGCDVNERCHDDAGLTALMWCVRYRNNISVLRCLLALNADVNLKAWDSGDTALHFAAQKNSSQLVKALLKSGANPLNTNKNDKTPLDVTVPNGYCFQLLRDQVDIWNTMDQFPRKTLYENRRLITAAIPWVFIPMVWAILLCFQSVIYTIGAVLVLAFLCNKLCTWTGQFSSIELEQATPLMFSVNAASIFYISFVFYTFFAPHLSWLQIIVSSYAAGGMVYFLMKAMTTDPGSISTSYSERIENIKTYVGKKYREEVKICASCMIRQPLRSKHCSEKNKCIAKFDHYCPFVANAVGAENLRYFLAFLLVSELAIGTYLLAAVQYYSINGLFDYKDGFFNMMGMWIYEHSVVTSTTGLAIAHILWIGALLVTQLYMLARNLTTNEFFTKKEMQGKFATPYSRGVVQNFVDVFRIQFPPLGMEPKFIDWTTIYELSDLLTVESDIKEKHI